MGDAVGDGVETRQLVLWDAQDGSTLNKVLLLEGCLLRVQSPWAAGLLGRGRASLRHWGVFGGGVKPHHPSSHCTPATV